MRVAGRKDELVALVVDDDEPARRLMQIVLAIEGYTVLTADGGEAALGVLARQVPDIVLVDFRMPGMDGPELCRRIRALPLAVPIVVLSGMDDAESKRVAAEAGADDFMVKPLDRTQLRDRIARLVPAATDTD